MANTFTNLNRDELSRYSRHILLNEIGEEGQLRLKNARVLVIGAGGLGCPILLYLAAAGVGTIGIADFDQIDATNLQRQVLYRTEDIGLFKAIVAADSLQRLNPHIMVTPHTERITLDNLEQLLESYDLVIDGSDNFATRYAVNDIAIKCGKPLVYGSIFQFDGQASVFGYQEGPCYRCLFPEPPPAPNQPGCSDIGVLGVLPGQIAMIQATEAIKIILNAGKTLSGRLLVYDAMEMTFESFQVPKNPECACCGSGELSYESQQSWQSETSLQSTIHSINADELKEKLDSNNEVILIDVRSKVERRIASLDPSVHIPMNELLTEPITLDKNAQLVVFCKTGFVSSEACQFLLKKGFSKVQNLEGGLDAWRDHVDPDLPLY